MRASADVAPAWGVVPLPALFLLALILFAVNGDFRLGFHPDEVTWTNNVLTSQWDLEQPLLLREVTQLVVRALRVVDAQRAVEIGRLICAVTAAAGIVGICLIVSPRAGWLAGLLAAAAAALTPLVAIHAHYFKDDAPLFACCAFAVLAFRGFLADPAPARIALLGVALGAAVSSKEPGLFLFPPFGLAILTDPRREWRTWLVRFAAASALACVAIVLANLPMLLEPARAATELGAETTGIFTGHWDGVSYAPGFHLTHSLWQGVGPAFLAFSALGLLLTVIRRGLADPIDRLMVIYAVMFYGIIELSPLKPGPDAGRYALPLVIPLAYFFGLAIREGGALLGGAFPRHQRAATIAAYAVTAGVLAALATTTIRLVADLVDDTRLAADRILAGKNAQIVTEMYGTSIGQSVPSLAALDLGQLAPDIRYLVASDLLYARYAYGAAVGGARNAAATETWSRYRAIFRDHGFCELRAPFMTYAMSNPTLRIIDLQAPPLPSGDAAAPLCAPGN